jgi:hypothetical protein
MLGPCVKAKEAASRRALGVARVQGQGDSVLHDLLHLENVNECS